MIARAYAARFAANLFNSCRMHELDGWRPADHGDVPAPNGSTGHIAIISRNATRLRTGTLKKTGGRNGEGATRANVYPLDLDKPRQAAQESGPKHTATLPALRVTGGRAHQYIGVLLGDDAPRVLGVPTGHLVTAESRITPPAVARIPDALQHLRISRSSLYRLIRGGQLRTVKLGPRATGITYAEITRFLTAQQ